MENQTIIEIPVEYKSLFSEDWREAAIYGGRFSLKSHTVARYLLIMTRQKKTRVGCFRELQNSITDSSHQLLSDLIKKYKLKEFRVTDKAIVNTLNGSDFLFKGLHHNEQSIKSIEGIDIAWVEEAQAVSKESIEVLTPTVRNKGSKIIYTYNRLLEDDPVHQRLVIEGRPNTLVINVNYDIAIKYKMMPDSIRLEMEDDKERRPLLYKHKWLGEPNSMERRIYPIWKIIDEIPIEARLERRGLDYGYTNDPAAIVDVYRWNQAFIWDEVLYRKGVSNKQLADIVLNQPEPDVLVIADSAEPKSNDELVLHGVNVLPANKGQGSVNHGIQVVKSQVILVTRRSYNIIRENRGYLWEVDKNGVIINTPEPGSEHALDAGRYAMETLNIDQGLSDLDKYMLGEARRNGTKNFSR